MRLLPLLGGERSLSRNPDGPDTLGVARVLSQAISLQTEERTVGRTWSQFSLGGDEQFFGRRARVLDRRVADQVGGAAQVDRSRSDLAHHLERGVARERARP